MTVVAIEADRDGNLYNLGSAAESYASVHDEAACSNVSTFNASAQIGQDYTTSTDKYNIRRTGLVFDTSGIPGDVVILSAVLSLYGSSKDVDQDFSITVVNGDDIAAAYPDEGYNDFIDTDYYELLDSVTSYGSMLASAFVVSPQHTENQITLNAAGKAAITKAGITRFGIRSSRDIGEDVPTNDVFEYITYDGGGSSYIPKLTITYAYPNPHVQAQIIC